MNHELFRRYPLIGMVNTSCGAQPVPYHVYKVVLQDFDARRDKLTIEHPDYAQLDFQPSFVEQMQGFKFVYLNPHDLADSVIEAQRPG